MWFHMWVPPKGRYPYAKLLDITSLKTTNLTFTALTTSDLIQCFEFIMYHNGDTGTSRFFMYSTPPLMDGHRNCKTSCMLNHKWVKGATLTKPELNVLHMDLHTILEHPLVFWTQT